MSQKNGKISVIIPSYNRSDALPATLLSLADQTMDSDDYEVLIVDDGSNDGSLALVAEMQQKLSFSIALLRQNRQGPAAARNNGAQNAKHGILLFWDSDMIAVPHLLDTHASIQTSQGPALVAGARRPWADGCTTTFSKVKNLNSLDRDQFAGRKPSFQEAFTCNLSVWDRDFGNLGGFDESLRAYEDIDLAYRAQKAGLPLIFSQRAYGYHNHPQTLEQACRQQQQYQRHAAAFLRKHPELAGQISHLVDKEPILWRNDPPALIVRKILRRMSATQLLLTVNKHVATGLERVFPNPKLLGLFYRLAIGGHHSIGYRNGLKDNHR